MPIIKVLPPDVRNKIAAGEVVERPASVVKELIENSIDAGSTEIRIEVLYGGKRMIKVVDNGSGMSEEDAEICFERHATSKLEKEGDLFEIRTLGFRGEALPSIASISKVRLLTGLREGDTGILIELHGGERKEKRQAPCSGTSIEVRDLFYNTPARKKFLKSNQTELFHIIDAVTKEALSNCGIHFALVVENRETMLLPRASGSRERIMQVYGEEFLAGLAEVSAEGGGMKIEAYVSKTDNFRSSRSHQFLFINGRPIKDQSLSHAVYAAYQGILPADNHPIFFLYLTLDPRTVDFNVHPAKREVRFGEKEAVYRFVLGSLRETVRTDRKEYVAAFEEPRAWGMPGQTSAYPSNSSFTTGAVSEIAELTYRSEIPYVYLGDTFIAYSGRAGLTIIDHHAAHERVLYERLLRRVALQPGPLLFPRQVKLSHKEYRALLDHKNILEEFCIELDDFGHDTVVVRTVPADLGDADLRGILADAASALLGEIHPGASLKESIAAKIACHSSVRGKEVLNREEFSRLLADLGETEHPDQCPHGRPTRIFYSLDDLKKLFKRK
jgi:DNA mismatch repair protein MutL